MQKVDKEKTRYYLAKIHILFRGNFRTQGVAFHDDGSDFHLFFSLLPDTAPDLLSIAFPGAGAKKKSFHERAYIPAAAPNAPTGAREKNDKECIGFCT